MDQRDVARELARMAERIQGAPDSVHTAEEVVLYAREQLGADHAGITLIRRGGRLQTVAPTNQLVEEADRLQYDLDEGPCHDSAWEGKTLVAQDLAADPRWPAWAPRAVALGIGSALGVELLNKAEDRRLGSVNLYWERPRVFAAEEIELAHLISRHAALALVASLNTEGLRMALEGRKRIGQAQGILMERHGLTEDQAFAVLKRYSQDNNVKLRDLAAHLVETHQLPDYGAPSAASGPSPTPFLARADEADAASPAPA
jgi:GAF domain-containing protein